MNISKKNSVGFIISGAILTVIFFFILIYNFGNYFEKKSFSDSAEQISGICTECLVHSDNTTEEYYISVEYNYNSNTFTVEDIVADRKYKTGETVTLFISTTNPTDIRMSLPDSSFNLTPVVILIPFTVLGILLILVGVKTLKPDKKGK